MAAIVSAHDDVHMDDMPLIGRDQEIARLGQLLDGLDAAGGAVLVRGDPGIGKTSLIRTAAQRAADRGHRVLATTGIESEANLPFAGLHLLLRPTLDRAETLPPSQREALLAAMGQLDGAAPTIYLVGMAVLNLLADLAAGGAVVAVADDAQWLDGPSAEVLA